MKLTIISMALAKQLGIDDLFTLINEHLGHAAIAVYVVIIGVACVEHRGWDELLSIIGEHPNHDEKKP